MESAARSPHDEPIERSRSRIPVAARWVLALGIVGSAAAGASVHLRERRDFEHDLDQVADAMAAELQKELDGHAWVLESLAEWLSTQDDIRPSDFDRIAYTVLGRKPSLTSLAWAPRVPAERRAEIVEIARATVDPEWELVELDAAGCLVPAGGREQYLPVLCGEPAAALQRWKGLDLAAGPAPMRPALAAIEAGGLHVSEPIRLGFDGGQSSVLALVPVYEPFADPPDAQWRAALLRGCVVASLRPDRLLEAVRSEALGGDVALLDAGAGAGEGSLLTEAMPPGLGDSGVRERSLMFGARQWRLHARPRPTHPVQPYAGLAPALATLLLTVLLTVHLTMRERRASLLAHKNEQLTRAVEEREEAARRLAESEHRFRSMFERHDACMWLVDVGTASIVEANPAAARFYGWSRDELRGMPLSVINPTPPDALCDLLQRAADSRGGPGVVTHRLRSGESRQIEVRASPVEFEGRKLLFSILHDVTERLRAEAERESVQRKLVQSQKLESLGVLASGIAHDFNNLLTAILGNAELALARGGTDEAVRRNLTALVGTSERAAVLTRELLAYAGKAAADKQVVDPGRWLAEFEPLLSRLVPKTVALEFQCSGPLPPIEVDVAQLQQVVLNLVLNGAEACAARPGHVRVSVAAESISAARAELWSRTLAVCGAVREGDYVRFDVIDSGAGMDEATLQRIFDPFFTTKFAGRGLGLAAVSGIVRAHGGALEVTSRIGAGSSFRFWLPGCSAVLPRAPLPAPEGGRGTELLLVVDDEAGPREVVVGMLEQRGYRTLVAAGGRAALALLSRHSAEIALAVLDVNMPEMSGAECLRELRAAGHELPVLLISGQGELDVFQQLDGLRFEGFLAKPFTTRALAAHVRALIDASGARSSAG